jgi:hypothetical protein
LTETGRDTRASPAFLRHPATREVENVEVMFFSTRLLRSDLFELPVTADLRLTAT